MKISGLNKLLASNLSFPNEMETLAPIDERLLHQAQEEWKNSLVGRLSSSKTNESELVIKATRKCWRLYRNLDIMTYHENMFLFRFDKREDLLRIVNQSPWTILGHLLILKPWSPITEVEDVDFNSSLFWVQLSGLRPDQMNQGIIKAIASTIGTVIRIDPPRGIPQTGRTFRARVDVDLQRPFPTGTWAPNLTGQPNWVSFTFEQLPSFFCNLCRRIGHVDQNCDNNNPTATPNDMLSLLEGAKRRDLPMNMTTTQHQPQVIKCSLCRAQLSSKNTRNNEMVPANLSGAVQLGNIATDTAMNNPTVRATIQMQTPNQIETGETHGTKGVADSENYFKGGPLKDENIILFGTLSKVEIGWPDAKFNATIPSTSLNIPCPNQLGPIAPFQLIQPTTISQTPLQLVGQELNKNPCTQSYFDTSDRGYSEGPLNLDKIQHPQPKPPIQRLMNSSDHLPPYTPYPALNPQSSQSQESNQVENFSIDHDLGATSTSYPVRPMVMLDDEQDSEMFKSNSLAPQQLMTHRIEPTQTIIHSPLATSCQDKPSMAAVSGSKSRSSHIRRRKGGQTSLERAVNDSKHPQGSPVVVSPYQQDWPNMAACSGSNDRSSHMRRPQHGKMSPERAVGHKSSECPKFSPMDGLSMAACSGSKDSSSHIGRHQHGRTSPERAVGHKSSERSKFSHMVGSSYKQDGSSQLSHSSSKDRLSKIGRPQHGRTSPEREEEVCSSEHSVSSPIVVPFDICLVKSGTLVKLKTPLHVKNEEKRRERERSNNGPGQLELRPGMVLLKNYISHSDQIKIIKICRDLGLGPGGFYQPGFRDGAKMNRQMMCLGKNWDPQTRSYENRRSTDDAEVPDIPYEFKKLVKEAIQASHALIEQDHGVSNAEDILPGMQPSICIMNFYTNSGKLGLHQDRDESKESLDKRLPVVSFSIGDSAEFLYGKDRDVEKAEKIVLESGDVLIFGGEARHIFHGVQSIIADSAPRALVEEADLRPGRLNLTFREY